MRLLDSDQIHSICKWFDFHDRSKFECRTEMSEHGAGTDALWFNVDATHGIKLFRRADVAEFSFHLGRIFAAMGLCPKVWGFSTLRIGNVRTPYFFMERAEPLALECNCELDSNGEFSDDYYEDKELWAEMQHYEEWLRDISCFHNADMHEGNYGRHHATGELMCIDIGHIAYADGEKNISLKWG